MRLKADAQPALLSLLLSTSRRSEPELSSLRSRTIGRHYQTKRSDIGFSARRARGARKEDAETQASGGRGAYRDRADRRGTVYARLVQPATTTAATFSGPRKDGAARAIDARRGPRAI